eukprot:18586-Heterococcus_DN1.PRE.2
MADTLPSLHTTSSSTATIVYIYTSKHSFELLAMTTPLSHHTVHTTTLLLLNKYNCLDSSYHSRALSAYTMPLLVLYCSVTTAHAHTITPTATATAVTTHSYHCQFHTATHRKQ